MLTLAILRVTSFVVFADAWRRTRTAAHLLLASGWLVLSVGALAAVLVSPRAPLFPAAAACGTVLLVAGVLEYFYPGHALGAYGVATVAMLLVLGSPFVVPGVAGTVAAAEQAAALIVMLAVLLTGRSAMRVTAPRSHRWLVVMAMAGTLHAAGFAFVYPDPLSAPAMAATFGINLLALLFILYLEDEMAEQELLASNERFRATFEQAAVGIVHVSADMRFVRVNQRFSEMTGYSREELLASMTVADITHPDDLEESASLISAVARSDVADAVMEKRYVRKDGSILWAATTVSSVRAEDDSLDYFIAVIRDITERKHLEAELRAQRARLEELVTERTQHLRAAYDDLDRANSAKSDFLAKMSHELRTPLNSVIGFTDLMLKGLAGPLTEEQERQLGMVRYSGEHLLALVNDVLDIERIEAGRDALIAERFDMCDLMDDVLGVMSPLAEERGLHLQLVCDGADPVCDTDPQVVRQILINLIGNAIKFTGDGEIRTVLVGEDGHIRVEVADTGCGIEPADMRRIFEPFFKGGSPQDAALSPGTGLGLSISTGLATLLGGTISAASEPGAGSTFTLRFPRRLPGSA